MIIPYHIDERFTWCILRRPGTVLQAMPHCPPSPVIENG
jgi:hypothetical protein